MSFIATHTEAVREGLTDEGDDGGGLAQLVGGGAGVVAELTLLNTQDSQGCVGVLVSRGKLGHSEKVDWSQHFLPVDGATGGKNGVVLPPPGNVRDGHAAGVARELNTVPFTRHHGAEDGNTKIDLGVCVVGGYKRKKRDILSLIA
ncbi:hypothetical protein E2C01_026528 [Portunus trituberculatus]|uniref:Uncharacterized protein n=1 Tax=Portunus trituberculatus TaxID=210409 RepID=A0A5B7EJ09_PORTR|nr:hypothetical protein [Portunus trituberculatus]